MSNKPTRVTLFSKNPHCHWCGVLTRMDAPNGADDQATVDHLQDKSQARRLGQQGRIPRHVLACYRCNQSRNRAAQERRRLSAQNPTVRHTVAESEGQKSA